MNQQTQTINIQINAGGDAARHLHELMNAANGVVDAERKLKAGGGMAGGGGGRGAGAMDRVRGGLDTAADVLSSGGSMAAVGALGRLGPAAAVAAAGLMLFDAGLAKATKTITLANDSTQTLAQKMNAWGDEFVPFHKQIREMGEAISGVSDRLTRQQDEFDVRTARQAAEQSRYAGVAGAEMNLARASGREYGLLTNRMGQLGRFDQGTVQGRFDAQAQQLTLAARDAQVLAARSEEEARRVARAAEVRANDAKREYNRTGLSLIEAQDRLGRLQAEENRTGIRRKGDIDLAAKDARFFTHKLADDEQRMGAEVERAARSRLELSEALTRSTQARVGVMQAELSVLQQQEQRMASLRQTLGGMARGQVAYSGGILRRIAERGIESVTPDMAAGVAGIAPDFIRAEQEKLGEKYLGRIRGQLTPQQMEKVFGKAEAAGQTLAGTRAQVQRVVADMRVVVELNTERVAEDMMKVFKAQYDQLIKGVKFSADTAERVERMKKADERNQQN